ncbi:hypothetical protein SARC_13202 [Sphaeroforma arctica JP610]|uniref:PIG-P domain-containing protein n=1 Tax=Sphaeroforma arctica JP610 TaxID=667725 RepID=A0A0L0FBW5_9EUKA|nr:hypothetical protein SARC_13202 [Sphaeroforma arctica JP610]KNC74245.1 hypothetical protein SARC_13202 [Sphaeroforma arctica JP610]|eukprot:XP_014148147.1 hypothetical protein SARC_13202 [Sphaeroforma arctica JP610]
MNSSKSINSNGSVHTAPHSTPQKATEIGKSPDKEIYGLVGYYCIWLVLALYTVYALVPDGVLRNYGIVLPSKWWVVAIPVYVCSLWVFLLSLYLAVNFYCTPPIDSLDTIRDEFTVHVPFPISPVHQKADPPVDATTDVTSDVKDVGTHPYAIPPVGDIPIQRVMCVLYRQSGT